MNEGLLIIAGMSWLVVSWNLMKLLKIRRQLARVQRDSSIDGTTGLLPALQFSERVIAERRRISRLGGTAEARIIQFASEQDAVIAGRLLANIITFPTSAFRLSPTMISLLIVGTDTSMPQLPGVHDARNVIIDDNEDEQTLVAKLRKIEQQLL